MSLANDRTLRDLEYSRVLSQVCGYASSSLGRAEVEALQPCAELARIKAELGRVGEMIDALAEAALPGGILEDLEPLLRQAHESTTLSGEAFLTILKTLESAREMKEWIGALRGQFPSLNGLAERIAVLRELEGAIRRTFDEEGEMLDGASPRLRQLMSRKRILEERVEERLKAYFRSSTHGTMIREPIITRRSSRLVIPIKSQFKHEFDCVVHDSSDSGQTLYIEPRTVIEVNNDIRELESEIRDERLRILRELTGKVQQESRRIQETLKAVGLLDGLYARARYAAAHDCVVPALNDRGRLSLQGARHPLLPGKAVVPIDLSFGADQRGVLITGPNTGGKTVTLKTVGLMTLMVQAGIPIPAEPESELAVFDVVRSDVGDEQSIQQNLSTFSSHMRNLVEVLNDANDRALVLIDELGAGTDPQEGAALGIGILGRLLSIGARFVVTTHFSALKHFGYQHEEIKTCSVEFDVGTLQPTYRLVEGVGSSNAFIIAQRLGLDDQIIGVAKGSLSEGAVKAEEIIRLLEQERISLSEERARVGRELESAARQREAYEAQLEAFEAEKEFSLRQELKALEAALRDGRAQLESALHNLHQRSEEELRASIDALESNRAVVAERNEERRGPAGRPIDFDALRVGESVIVRPVDEVGIVREIANAQRVLVEVGGVRLQVRADDLAEAVESGPSSPSPKRTTRVTASSLGHRVAVESPGLELHVRGLTVTEALREVDLYLDRLVLADVQRASIVHGKGTGALRREIRRHLETDPRIARFYSAPVQQGGDGVTIVEL